MSFTKKWLSISFVCALVLASGAAIAAKPDFHGTIVTNPGKGDARNTVSLPAGAVEVAPNVFFLGLSVENGELVQGYAIITYRKGYGKPSGECGNGVCEPGENARKCPADCSGGGGGEEPDTSSCYGFMAKGARWKTLEPYVVNPSNTRGLGQAYVTGNLADDIGKWESAAGTDILGQGSRTDQPLEADFIRPDGSNEVYFGSIEEPGAIAVTVVWGYFGSPPPFRELIEWDQVYDEDDYDWSEDCLAENCSSKMDFESIATHELGHSVGLADLYTETCSQQTMYGYAVYGETHKRTLESGDVTGVGRLYQ